MIHYLCMNEKFLTLILKTNTTMKEKMAGIPLNQDEIKS